MNKLLFTRQYFGPDILVDVLFQYHDIIISWSTESLRIWLTIYSWIPTNKTAQSWTPWKKSFPSHISCRCVEKHKDTWTYLKSKGIIPDWIQRVSGGHISLMFSTIHRYSYNFHFHISTGCMDATYVLSRYHLQIHL